MRNKIRLKLVSIYRRLFRNEFRKLAIQNGAAHISINRSMRKSFNQLWDSEVKIFSQCGEDGILDYLCEVTGIAKPKSLEIGAGIFEECNTRFLSENRNGSLYAVDASSGLIENINKQDLMYRTHIQGSEQWITTENVSEIFKEAKTFMDGVDILSLDLDGNDYWLMCEIPFDEVKIIVVEYNPLFGHKNAITVPMQNEFDRFKEHHSALYFGASLKAWINLFEGKGFTFVGSNRIGNNAFFIANEYSRNLDFKVDNNLEVYCDWRVRESRDQSGNLNYLSGNARVRVIQEMPVVNLEKNELTTLGKMGL